MLGLMLHDRASGRERYHEEWPPDARARSEREMTWADAGHVVVLDDDYVPDQPTPFEVLASYNPE